jgi:hypothetical protein
MARKISRAKRGSQARMHMETVDDELLQRNLPVLTRSMTFARMVRANTQFISVVKDLRWLFPPVCQRKDQAALTETEKTRYVCAFNMLNSDGTLGHLVDIHSEMHMQHTNARLLPWHRVFLYLFEEALHNYHPDVCIPYWDWTRPEEQHFPDWLTTVLPTVQTPTRTINVVRSPGSGGGLASIHPRPQPPWQKRTTPTSPVSLTVSTGRYTSGWEVPCPMLRFHPPTQSFGFTMPTSTGSGGFGTTALKGTIKTRPSPAATP